MTNGLDAAARSYGSGGTLGLPWWAVLLVIAALIAFSYFRLRRGGPGPAVSWVPKRPRASMNRQWERHGWPPPFDDAGNRRTDR